MKESAKKFRTKTGYCHVFSDKIVLTTSETVGEFSEMVASNTIHRVLIIQGLIVVFLGYSAFTNFSSGNMVFGFLWSFFVLYFLYNIVNSLNNSATPVIYRSQIEEITFVPAVKMLARAYFSVRFKDEEGVSKKRLILLPGSLNKGAVETEIAVNMMKEEGLL
ncbi:MAG: hypothetical protein R3E32_07905 [Chitinophagales bacterium]